MPPANDTQLGAIILEGESGTIDGTTLETVPGELLEYPYISNGRDVWYKLRVGWLRSFAELRQGYCIPYLFQTANVEFRHIIRVYCKVGTNWEVYDSRGWLTPGYGKRQRVEFIQNAYEFPTTRTNQDFFIYVQVDAVGTDLETGNFTLLWSRSSVPSIGALDEHPAFTVPRSNAAIFIGAEQVTDVSQANTKWYAAGEELPEGDYFWMYCGGVYKIEDDGANPLFMNMVKLLYNDGNNPASELVTQFATNNLMESVVVYGKYYISLITFGPQNELSLRMGSRFFSGQIAHKGGPIGMRFENFSQGSFWQGPTSLPFWNSENFFYYDQGLVNNMLMGVNVTYGLWAILFTALDDILFVRTFRTGVSGSQITVQFYFQNATDTRANLTFTTLPTGGVTPVSPPQTVTFVPGTNQITVTWSPSEKTDVVMTFKVEADSAFSAPPFNRPPPTKFFNIPMTPVIRLPATITGQSAVWAGSIRRVTALMNLTNTGWGPTFNMILTITFVPNAVIFTPPPPTGFSGPVFQGVGNLQSSRLVSFLAFETTQLHGSAVVYMKLSDGVVIYDEGYRTITW